ncbi:MAG: RHS repeat-associated core domain-containing protein [Blastocatellia bacterium]
MRDGASCRQPIGSAAANSSTYEYDGDGGRVRQINGSGTLYYLRSSVLGDVVAEIAGGMVYRSYVRGGQGQTLAVRSYGGDSDMLWVHADHIGSSRTVTNSSGALVYKAHYDPYGQLVAESNPGNAWKHSRKFTGYERDWATNLDFANARTSDYRRGRFLQPDPLGLGASDLTAPQSLNAYAYVENDPVKKIDPSGMNAEMPECYLWP